MLSFQSPRWPPGMLLARKYSVYNEIKQNRTKLETSGLRIADVSAVKQDWTPWLYNEQRKSTPKFGDGLIKIAYQLDYFSFNHIHSS